MSAGKMEFVKESGRLPACTDSGGNCGCDAVRRDEEVRGAYVAIVLGSEIAGRSGVAYDSVLFAKLSGGGLCAGEAAWRVLAGIRRDDGWATSMDEMSYQLRSGMYSSGEDGCSECSFARGVCDECDTAADSQPRFVVQTRYMGVYPRGREHWMRGVTDCGGEMVNGKQWLRCRSAE
jgi:hypothetical protein